VAARSITANQEAWEQVARQIYQRRLELGLTAHQAVERAGPGLSVTVLSLLENARQTSYSVRTIAALCRALDWTPDSIERIIDGRPPITADDTSPDEPTIEDRIAAIEAELEALKARLVRRARA